MPDSPLRTVAIVGSGLIGSSFGLGLRKAGFDGLILGVDRPPYAEAALKVGAIDQISTLPDAAAVADLLYLSGTVYDILEAIKHLGKLVRPGCLVTDVGSTKRAIADCAALHLPSESFVGGHPMAGKEKRGAENADADLFRDRPYILTSRSPLPACAAFVALLEKMGASIIDMDAAQHDVTVAFSSHLPQLLATALACSLAERTDLPITKVFGSGLTDMTRLALSAPGLWASILDTNRDQVLQAIDTYILELSRLRNSLSTDQLMERFEIANQYAYLLRSRP